MRYSYYYLIFCILIGLTAFVNCYLPFSGKSILVPKPYKFRSLSLSDIESIHNGEQYSQITLEESKEMPLVIDFQKSQCKPCKRIAPEFEALAVKYSSSIKFYKVDADSSKDALAVLKSAGIRSVPSFHIWKDGAIKESIQGAHMDELEEILNSLQSF